ncbi:DNA phosphorothioation-dependent restriction protein DptG [Marinospirillum insulare]|uniref:DNA phosphorothioation-dependent restriction protein DptG n=1 Tax=Marinospirillum insulare TaxID=217169 RepID=UPI001B7FFDA5|nr:DNA phosphorothioation-dependent restriction protein DptG [Marinospirillum insulare]
MLKKAYFDKGMLLNVAPELATLRGNEKEMDNNTKNLGKLFTSLLCKHQLESSNSGRMNFIEREFKALFDQNTEANKPTKASESTSYLPFLSELFAQDLDFMNKRPQYFMANLNSFARLYGFLYTAQTALNIRNWQAGEPTSKRCYLIIDTEKAGSERNKLQLSGFKHLREQLEYLFPYLAMSESLQEKDSIAPLWQLAQALPEDDSELADRLEKYAKLFIKKRNLPEDTKTCAKTPVGWLKELLKLSHMQFHKSNSRHKYNQDLVKGQIQALSEPFVQSRGRAGQVLVINQDYLVLLTNLAIGEKDKLRLHELIKAFEARGIWFDKQSQQALVAFYERMGNVERMSDSGDAVYVKKTV